MRAIRINIGAGRTRIPGFTNVDIVPWADVSIDLEREPLPFDDDSAMLVFSDNTLEHLDNYLGVLAEIHRVLVHGGWLLVGLPYVTLTEYHLVNPYHRQRGFNEHSFAFFESNRLRGSAVEQSDVEFVEVFHELHYMPEFQNASDAEKEWSRRHLLNVVRSIDFGLQAVKSDHALPSSQASNMKACFRECRASREPYPDAQEAA